MESTRAGVPRPPANGKTPEQLTESLSQIS